MKRKEFKPYSPIKLLKECKCPIKVLEPPYWYYEYIIAFFEGMFWLLWYMCIIAGYFYYIIGYCIYWAISTIILKVKERKNGSQNSDKTN